MPAGFLGPGWFDAMMAPRDVVLKAEHLLRELLSVLARRGRPFAFLTPEGRALRRVQTFARESRTTLDLLVVQPGRVRDHLFANALVIDRIGIDERIDDVKSPLGYFDPGTSARISNLLAKAVIRRLVREVDATSAKRSILRDAWYFPLWTELCSIVPLRHLARQIADEAGDRLILLPIDQTEFNCLKHWHPSEIDAFVLAAELRRRGARVLLVAGQQVISERAGHGGVKLSFGLSKYWIDGTASGVQYSSIGRAVALEGIRNARNVLERLKEISPRGTDAAAEPWKGRHLWASSDGATRVDVDLADVFVSKSWSLWTPSSAVPKLDVVFRRLLEPLTDVALANTRDFVEATGTRDLHICDHLFFRSAILAHTVSEFGGRVTVWPHSSNAAHVPYREPGFTDRAIAITRTGARLWETVMPAESVVVDSSVMMSPDTGPRETRPDAAVHVVVFAGAYRIGRLPLVHYRQHLAAWREFLAALDCLPDGIEVHLKPKPPWEGREWFEGLLEPGSRLKFTSTHANDLDFPNMVFVSVTLGSSALMEGLGRGIPCMIVRTVDIEDYTTIDPVHFPVGDVAMVIAELKRCRDPKVLEDMTREQLAFYRAECVFP